MPPSSYHSWHALYDPFLTSGKAQSEVPWDNCLVTCIFLNPTNTKLFFLSFGSFVFFCKPLPVHCVPFNWNIFFTSSLCILVTDLLICHIFGKTQSFQQTVWIFKWDVKPSTRKHKTESCDMLLLKRGGAYNTHPKAKMPSSLPFYTLTVFVLMTPGLWEGVGWPLCARLCRGISPGDSHRSTLPKEDEWRAALDTAQWGLPCAPPTHTPRTLLIQGRVSRPLHQDPALYRSLPHWGQPWECREAMPIPAGIRNLRPNGTPSGWRPFWWGKPGFMGTPCLGPAANKPSVKGHFPGSC